MRTGIMVALILTACAMAHGELTSIQLTAKKALEEVAKMEQYRGSVFAQAKAHGIDYRTTLNRAIGQDKDGLKAMFSLNFTGEAGETHCQNLLLLMQFWGDKEFSKVLVEQPANVRALVVSGIDYAWVEPKWNKYAATQAVSP